MDLFCSLIKIWLLSPPKVLSLSQVLKDLFFLFVSLWNLERRENIIKIKKLTKITIMKFTNGSKVMSFRGGNYPLTPILLEVRTSQKLVLHTPLAIPHQEDTFHSHFIRSPHLPKISPAYAPGYTPPRRHK